MTTRAGAAAAAEPLCGDLSRERRRCCSLFRSWLRLRLRLRLDLFRCLGGASADGRRFLDWDCTGWSAMRDVLLLSVPDLRATLRGCITPRGCIVLLFAAAPRDGCGRTAPTSRSRSRSVRSLSLPLALLLLLLMLLLLLLLLPLSRPRSRSRSLSRSQPLSRLRSPAHPTLSLRRSVPVTLPASLASSASFASLSSPTSFASFVRSCSAITAAFSSSASRLGPTAPPSPTLTPSDSSTPTLSPASGAGADVADAEAPGSASSGAVASRLREAASRGCG